MMRPIFYLILLFLLLFLLTATACKEIRYIPVENKSTEYIDRYQRDSIMLYDSIHIRERGDTVWLEKYKYLYRDRLLRDSVYITDSIAVPYPVEVVREVNKLLLYQKVLIYAGLASLLVLLVYFIYKYCSK